MRNSNEVLRRGLLGNWKEDLPAGVVVFLVALPLCLGIALASGTPLISGLISGIVAGVLVSFLSGSPLSVSGPAAGLTVIVATQTEALGGFSQFLVAVVLAGLIQIAFGFLKAGILGSVFPNSVIKGMLAAIGLIILLKQIPHAVGWDSDYEGDLSFFQFTDHENTFSEIAKALEFFSPGAVLISIVSLGLLILWETSFWKKLKISKIPGPLLAVGVGLGMNELFKWIAPEWVLTRDQQQLVALPEGSVMDVISTFHFPDFSAIGNSAVWTTALTLAVIASIETLLSVEAVDRLDPFKRVSDANRELWAQGVGNMVSGLLGGLPMTAVIVRSSANVYAGGRTMLSNLVHGILLLAAVFVFSKVLNHIPLAALAAILILVGYKLSRVSLFKEVYQKGFDQFIPFVVTVVAVLFTDLLTGVLIGFAIGLIVVIRSNYHSAVRVVSDGDHYLIRLNKDVTFVNKIPLRSILMSLPDNVSVIIDGTQASVIDRDIMEVISDFKEASTYRGIEVTLRNLDNREVPPLFFKWDQKASRKGAKNAR